MLPTKIDLATLLSLTSLILFQDTLGIKWGLKVQHRIKTSLMGKKYKKNVKIMDVKVCVYNYSLNSCMFITFEKWQNILILCWFLHQLIVNYPCRLESADIQLHIVVPSSYLLYLFPSFILLHM